jgi:3-oxoacyl-[acyl-carrier protein] reductase
MTMDLGLQGKVVFITGASGGIGRALAGELAAEGARLALHAHRDLAGLAAFVAERRLDAVTVRADVSQAAEIDAAMDAAAERLGRIDVCVVNAGVWPPEDVPLHQMDEARIRRVLDVNLLGAMFTARAFLRRLAIAGPRGDGFGAGLVFIGSTAGRFGERGHVEYAAAKAALRGVVLSLKNEIVHLDPAGRANLVEPGWTRTEMAAAAIDRNLVESALRTMPLRRLGTPEDVARTVTWLASPASRHITGAFLMVAGGMEGRVLWPGGSSS